MADALAQALKWRRQVEQLQKVFATVPAAAATACTEFPADPVDFASSILHFQPWSKQAAIMRACREHRRVAVRSGHRTGKSSAAAALALWWVCTKPRGRVIVTSTSAQNVREVLWREITALYGRARERIGGRLHETPSGGLRFADGRELLGVSTDKPERMAGIAGSDLLFVVDEASGVDALIFDAIIGNLAGGGHVLLTGNPTQTSGIFHEAFHGKREFWHLIHVSSEDSPNITGEMQVPGLAVKSWVDEQIAEHGDPSEFVDVRVKGNFPTQAANTVIGVGMVEAAIRRWNEQKEEARALRLQDGPLELGVDPARYGDDDSAITARRGLKVAPLVVLRGLDGGLLAMKVIEVVNAFAKGRERPRVKVDVGGIGASCFDFLIRSEAVEAIPVDAGSSPTVEPVGGSVGYERLRDQLWFGARDWLKAGGMFPADAKLESELIAPRYNFSLRQRLKVEAKDDLKKRLRRSPDRADSLCLSIFNPPDPGMVEMGRMNLMNR